MRYIIKISIVLFLTITANLLSLNYANAQFYFNNYGALNGYIIGKNTTGEVHLYEYDNSSQLWTIVGNTNRTDIESISIHPANNTIYTVSNGELGTLNNSTGAFQLIGSIGTANGALGQITLNNIYGLTCSYTENAIYITHREIDTNGSRSDLLSKIEMETGRIIPNSFLDSNDNETDYVIIAELQATAGSALYTSVVDININPAKNNLYVLHADPFESLYTAIDIKTGELEDILDEISKPVQGFCFNNLAYYDNSLDNFSHHIYFTTKAKFTDANNSVESELWYWNTFDKANNFEHNTSITGINLLDIDFVKSPCAVDLTIAENASTGVIVYPFQRSSNLITTETTNSSNVDVFVDQGIVEFKSNHIALNAGFQVSSMADFKAIIDPCE